MRRLGGPQWGRELPVCDLPKHPKGRNFGGPKPAAIGRVFQQKTDSCRWTFDALATNIMSHSSRNQNPMADPSFPHKNCHGNCKFGVNPRDAWINPSETLHSLHLCTLQWHPSSLIIWSRNCDGLWATVTIWLWLQIGDYPLSWGRCIPFLAYICIHNSTIILTYIYIYSGNVIVMKWILMEF
jgi:hypothetical protein